MTAEDLRVLKADRPWHQFPYIIVTPDASRVVGYKMHDLAMTRWGARRALRKTRKSLARPTTPWWESPEVKV